MKQQKPIKLRMDVTTYYIWVGGSCDYVHEERAGGEVVVNWRISALLPTNPVTAKLFSIFFMTIDVLK